MTSLPPFVHVLEGRTRAGVLYVSDGAAVLRADLVSATPADGGPRELTADQLASVLDAPPRAFTPLAALVPSAIASNVFRTADSVPIAAKYVELLRSMQRALVLGTTGDRGVLTIREGSTVLGALMPVAVDPEPLPEPRTPFGMLFAQAILTHGFTRVSEVAGVDQGATAEAPAHRVHVLQRIQGEHREPSYFVVTGGLSYRPLEALQPSSMIRFELAAWTAQHDPSLARMLSALGRIIHDATRRGTPYYLGDTMAFEGDTIFGWPAVLLARMFTGIPTAWGPVDVARVVPIDEAERDRARNDPFGGWGLVTELENMDVQEVLGRWYARRS
jgi:hypothetical protein